MRQGRDNSTGQFKSILPTSLCLSCNKANPCLCSWMALDDEEGREVKWAEIGRPDDLHNYHRIASVVRCGDHEPGELPPLAPEESGIYAPCTWTSATLRAVS